MSVRYQRASLFVPAAALDAVFQARPGRLDLRQIAQAVLECADVECVLGGAVARAFALKFAAASLSPLVFSSAAEWSGPVRECS